MLTTLLALLLLALGRLLLAGLLALLWLLALRALR